MTIAVAHHTTTMSEDILAAAVSEAAAHDTGLVVLNVVTTTDLDAEQALNQGISDLVEAASARVGAGVPFEVVVVASASTAPDDVAEVLLQSAVSSGATMLVIGARRRSPVGKAFLGSVTQEVILASPMPVLVVTAPPGTH